MTEDNHETGSETPNFSPENALEGSTGGNPPGDPETNSAGTPADPTGIARLMTQPNDKDRVEEVILRMASPMEPVTWQAIAKRKDRSSQWGVYVSQDPVEAVAFAIEAAMGLRRNKALFHQSRPEAEELRQGIEDIFEGVLAYTKTEFEPYQGFVVVVALPDDKRKLLAKFADQVEFRSPEASSTRSTHAPGGESTYTPGPRQAKATVPGSAGPAPKGGKKELEELWKSKHGKFPPREWKKAELIEKLRAEGLME